MPTDWSAFPVLPALLAGMGTFWIALLTLGATSRPILLPVVYGIALFLPAVSVALRKTGGPTTRRFWFSLYVLGALGLTFLIAFTNQVFWPVLALINSAALAEVMVSMRHRSLIAFLVYMGKIAGIAIMAMILFGLSIFAPNPAGYIIAAVPLVLLAVSPRYRRRNWTAATEALAGLAYLISVTLTQPWLAEHPAWGSPVGFSGVAALIGVIAAAALREPVAYRTLEVEKA